MDIAIETSHLTKVFEKPRGWRRLARLSATTAVNDVNLTVKSGELFGLLGPNGAGKTTLVKTLCTLILPTSGTASVAGYPLASPGKIRQQVGLVVSDERSFYWRLSGRKNLEFFAAMYRLGAAEVGPRVRQVLADVDLTAHADKRFSDYSTGMKQRLAIARSLLHRPKILFLDEPSRSLDPGATRKLHELILELVSSQQVTIFLITHDLAEAEKLCQRVALMHRGRIQVVGEPANLRRQLQPQRRYKVLIDELGEEAKAAVSGLVPNLQHESTGGHVLLQFHAPEDGETLTAMLDCLRQHQAHILSIEGRPPSLEEVFAHFTAS